MICCLQVWLSIRKPKITSSARAQPSLYYPTAYLTILLLLLLLWALDIRNWTLAPTCDTQTSAEEAFYLCFHSFFDLFFDWFICFTLSFALFFALFFILTPLLHYQVVPRPYPFCLPHPRFGNRRKKVCEH